MHAPSRTFAAACAISAACGFFAALLVTGCSGSVDRRAAAEGGQDVLLQPLADAGPDPFTDSSARSVGASPPVTRTPQTGAPSATTRELRAVEGGASGLYGGTRSVASCDVERQIRLLGADRGTARAFARAEGISAAAVPGYLRGLTPVVLRMDVRVTSHGYRDGRAAAFQSVLQAGTAVLVDDRGVPRVRCACGNPLEAAAQRQATAPPTRGEPWSGYLPSQIVVVTPAPRILTHLTLADVRDDAWFERRTGDDGPHDRPVAPPPDRATPTPPASPSTTPSPDCSSPSDAPDTEAPSEPDDTASSLPDEPGSTQAGAPAGPAADCASPPSPSDDAPTQDDPWTLPALPPSDDSTEVNENATFSTPPATPPGSENAMARLRPVTN